MTATKNQNVEGGPVKRLLCSIDEQRAPNALIWKKRCRNIFQPSPVECCDFQVECCEIGGLAHNVVESGFDCEKVFIVQIVLNMLLNG